jgi:hypothetical protein
MSPLLLATLLVVGADAVKDDPKADAPKLDGKWLIVYAEENGRRNNSWEQRQATIEGTTLSYKEDTKDQSLALTFGPHQTLKASFKGEKDGDKKDAFSGVYIAGQDYLCISLNKGEAKDDKAKGTSSGAFILILRKQQK